MERETFVARSTPLISLEELLYRQLANKPVALLAKLIYLVVFFYNQQHIPCETYISCWPLASDVFLPLHMSAC
jgi:hypothetical protein